VRAIAAEAGVNVATVHYYFGTKDAVVSTALRAFFATAIDYFRKSLGSDLAPREKLVAFLVAYSGLFHENPGLFASFIEVFLHEGRGRDGEPLHEYERILLDTIATMKPRMLELVAAIAGIEDERELTLKTIRMMTSVIHPIMLSGLPMELFGLDLRDEETRRRYIESAVDSL
jgi:Transcriptional regulator